MVKKRVVKKVSLPLWLKDVEIEITTDGDNDMKAMLVPLGTKKERLGYKRMKEFADFINSK